MNILYISYCLPYSEVSHAGGQTFFYYISNMVREKNYNIKLISYCSDEEFNKEDISKLGISLHPIIWPKGYKRLLGRAFSLNSKINPFYKYANLMTSYSIGILESKVRKLKKEGYEPEVIVLEWTQMVLLIDLIKKYFPYAKYVASEHDVTYLGWIRKTQATRVGIKERYKKLQTINLKNKELSALSQCDLVFTHNEKDRRLLNSDGKFKEGQLDVLVPYYHRSKLIYKRKSNDILFFGYMAREENEISALWFIEKVMPLLNDLDVRFVVIGGGPTEKLKARASDKVIITGYVKSTDPVFSQSMCSVAPLQLGAGVKVKVIEAMYSGITVLANDIGIEGIPAEDKKDYYHCSEPEEFADCIRKIYNDQLPLLSGKDAIEKGFGLENSFSNYEKRILGLVENNDNN